MNAGHKRFFFLCASLSLLFLATESLADQFELNPGFSGGRYITFQGRPETELSDVFSVILQVHFSHQIRTVNDALQEVLRPSGYSLVDTTQQSAELKNILQKPLPLIQREMGPLSLRQILIILIGSPFELVVDPLQRTIDFAIKNSEEKIGG